MGRSLSLHCVDVPCLCRSSCNVPRGMTLAAVHAYLRTMSIGSYAHLCIHDVYAVNLGIEYCAHVQYTVHPQNVIGVLPHSSGYFSRPELFDPSCKYSNIVCCMLVDSIY